MEEFCKNVIMIFGTIAIIPVCLAFAVGFSTILLDEFGIELPWEKKDGTNK